jgi:RecB family exonuclease
MVRRLLTLFDQLKLGVPPAEELGATLRAELRPGRGGERGATLTLDAIGQGGRAVHTVREQALGIAQAARDLGCAARPCDAAELCAEIERTAAEAGVRPEGSAAAAGAVRIDLPAGFAGLDHDLVVVTGLDARAYGAGAGAEEALLGEHLRARLPAPSRPASARERQAWQRAELAWTIAGARWIAVSFTRGDEAEPNDPHPVYRWAAARAGRERDEPASRVAAGASRLGPRGAELIATAAGAPPAPDIAERARIERIRASFFLDPRAAGDAYSGQVDLDADAPLRAQLQAAVGGARPDKPIAVTHIERAAGCAFAGFARRVLRVRRVEDLLESADARERGTLVHRALQASFEVLRELGPDREPADLLAAARVAAEAALGAGRPVTPLRREAIDKAIADVLQVVVRAIEAVDPVRFLLAERRFGAGEAPPWEALELAPEEEGRPSLHVDGQIDRIDRSADGRVARVIDYKTGRPPEREEQLRGLQLPLYAAVVARALRPEEVQALYISVRQRGLVEESPRTPDAQRALAAQSPEAARTARRVVQALWDGRVTPRPARDTLCVRCDARDVCRRPAVIPIEEPATAEEQA